MGKWYSITDIKEYRFKCGYCGENTGTSRGYHSENNYSGIIYICGYCDKPTHFDKEYKQQTPGPILIPKNEYINQTNVAELFEEAIKSYANNNFTATVMCCRKLLMNIAVTNGAAENKNFVYYVDWLNDNHYIPPNSKEWVDKIRQLGNEANHEIITQNEKQAFLALKFTDMLLRIIYEMPGILEKTPNKE